MRDERTTSLGCSNAPTPVVHSALALTHVACDPAIVTMAQLRRPSATYVSDDVTFDNVSYRGLGWMDGDPEDHKERF